MPSIRRPDPRLRAVAAVVSALTLVGPAAAAGRSPGAQIRLISAGSVDGRPALGLEIALEPGWKTYWRTPGDAGVPPTVDWSRSTGVAAFDLHFPAPVRFGEEGVQSIGYGAPVILPIDLALADPKRPAHLDLDVQIGICHDICVPLAAHLEAIVAPDAPLDAAARDRLATARTDLPKPADPGLVPWVAAVRRAGDGLSVEVAMPADPAAARDVLVEGPTADWALPLPERIGDAGPRETWHFALDGIPRGAGLAGTSLRFTLRGGDRVVEQEVALDAAALSP